MYFIQHCFIGRPLDSTVSEDAGIEPKTVATFGNWQSDALTTFASNFGTKQIYFQPFAYFRLCVYSSRVFYKICLGDSSLVCLLLSSLHTPASPHPPAANPKRAFLKATI
jgi:hypothetical protein